MVEVGLDVHDVAVQFAPWYLAHGLVLTSVGLTLQDAVRKLYVPAGQSHRDLFPLLTHPLLDPLWSTETLEVVHDGCEATRFEKIQVLRRDEIALDHLAVCNKPWAVVNCGGCEKCLRTMTNLHLAGALERTSTLPDTVSHAPSPACPRSATRDGRTGRAPDSWLGNSGNGRCTSRSDGRHARARSFLSATHWGGGERRSGGEHRRHRVRRRHTDVGTRRAARGRRHALGVVRGVGTLFHERADALVPLR